MLSGFQWSPAATPLVAGLAGELRRRYVALIQRAYATLTAAQLAAYLGVDQAEALQSTFPSSPPSMVPACVPFETCFANGGCAC